MILGFKQRFVPSIQSGVKIHTIRKDSKNRWKQGNKIHFATGIRTKHFNCFLTGECKSIQKVKIEYDLSHAAKVYIDDRLLNHREIFELATNDGFEGAHDFFQWFNEDFEGKIIHWTTFKY